MYKKYIYSFFFVICFVIISFISLAYVKDPYMIFHKHWFYSDDEIVSDERKQMYGLSKFMDFDGIILGTSMLQNTLASDAEREFGGKFFNLSISGSGYIEKYFVLKNTLKEKKIKQVIISLDMPIGSFDRKADQFNISLYDGALYDKFSAYLDSSSIKCLFSSRLCNFIKFNKDAPYSFNRNLGFENWKIEAGDIFIGRSFITIAEDEWSVDTSSFLSVVKKYLEPLVQENSDVKFYFIYPPYSSLFWRFMKNVDDFIQRWGYDVISNLSKFPNVEIYWFANNNFVNDLVNYYDWQHYSKEINAWMLHQIALKKDLINVENMSEKFNDFKKNIQKFDYNYYYVTIRKILGK